MKEETLQGVIMTLFAVIFLAIILRNADGFNNLLSGVGGATKNVTAALMGQ